MHRPKRGDVFELNTHKGRVYYQYTHDHPFGPIVRVLPGEYRHQPEHLSDVVAGPDRFVLISPVPTDLRAGRISSVRNIPIPKQSLAMPAFRAELPGSIDGKDVKWALDVEGKVTMIRDQTQARDLPI